MENEISKFVYDWMFGLLEKSQSKQRIHKRYTADSKVFFCSSEERKMVLSKRTDIFEAVFDCVDSLYKPDAFTKAYKAKDNAYEILNSFFVKDSHKKIEYTSVLKEEVRVDKLQSFEESGIDWTEYELSDLKLHRAYCEKVATIVTRNNVEFYQRQVGYKSCGKSARQVAIGTSLQSSTKRVRAYLLEDSNFADLDIVNAQVSILNQVTKGRFEALNYYCNNREQCLSSSWNSREDMKTAWIALTFGSKISSLKVLPTEEMIAFSQDIKQIKKELKVNNSELACFVQEIENRIVSIIKDSLEGECKVLIYDGLISTQKESTDRLETIIKEQTGFDIKLTQKVF